jgi:branched-chain amino acid transport system substrate-binding protein
MVVTLAGGAADPKFGAQVGKSANGVFNSTSFAIDLPKIEKVAAAYLEKYKSSMSTNAAQGYQTTRTIAEVLDLAGSKSPDAIAAAIRKINTPGARVTTSSAFIEFEGSLNKGRRALLTQWQNGKLVTIWPDDVAVGPAITPSVNTK